MNTLFITAISLLATLFALPADIDASLSQADKAIEGKSHSHDGKIIFAYNADKLPKLGPDGDFSYFQAGDFVANDAKLSVSKCGLVVNSYPFTHYATNVLDHVKFLVLSNRSFDVPCNGEISFSAKISMQAFDVQNNPFGPQVQDAQSDFRLAASAFNVVSLSTGFVFDFFITNTKIYALYERLDFSRGVLGNYASYTFVIPVARNKCNESHLYTMTLNGKEKSVSWLVDGQEVYKAYTVGSLLSRQFMALDLGGQEEIAFPTSVQVGFGTFTLLDGYSPCNVQIPALDGGRICHFPVGSEGLVRLSPPGAQLDPRNGVTPATFLKDGTNPLDHIWGQGVIMNLQKLYVSLNK